MKNLFSALLLLLSTKARAPEWQESPTLAQLFKRANLKGTFVLYDVSADTFTGYDRTRADTRFVPDSTFKIVNSLIGLSTATIRNVSEVLPYGGQPQPFPEWQRDLGLRDAIKVSSVPVYQELARRIGLERMQDFVRRLEYGNAQVGDSVDDFWLAGPLKISALEQVRFLARLAQERLPLPETVQATVRDLICLEQGKDWTLYGKTGWVQNQDPDLGWWVGWIEKQGLVYTFALNIDMPNPQERHLRIDMGRDCLRSLGIL